MHFCAMHNLQQDYNFKEYFNHKNYKNKVNLAKLDDGLAESPTFYGCRQNKTKKKKPCENRGILKPSWAFVETNNKLVRCDITVNSPCSCLFTRLKSYNLIRTNFLFGLEIVI